MLWLLVLHITALLSWCAGLLYLLALISNVRAGRTELTVSTRQHDSAARFVFTHAATPAALVAIISGTLVFLLNRTVEVWLIAKLSLVAVLVVGHALSGLLVLRAENDDGKPVQPWCWLLATALGGLMVAITWVVLAKPASGPLP
jgi:protoporphyrinogen IX oxidase